MKPRQNILVLCAQNSARSRMAEAFLRRHGGDRFAIHSAGVHPTEIHPLTRRVTVEVGLPLDGHYPKPARERECPKLLLGALRRHFRPFPDPTTVEGGPERQLAAFRTVRDDIQHRVLEWLREPDGPGAFADGEQSSPGRGDRQ
jgi:arsenate reductase (thioredoxin)